MYPSRDLTHGPRNMQGFFGTVPRRYGVPGNENEEICIIVYFVLVSIACGKDVQAGSQTLPSSATCLNILRSMVVGKTRGCGFCGGRTGETRVTAAGKARVSPVDRRR